MNWWALRRRVHTSWLIATTSVGVVIGVWLASVVWQGWFAPVVWLMSGLSLVLSALYWRYVALVPLCVIGGIVIGLWRGSVDQSQLTAYEQLMEMTIEIHGKVMEDIDSGAGGQVVLRLGTVSYGSTNLPGSVWVTTSRDKGTQRSDRVTVRGKLKEGFGSFAATMYRAEIVRIERPHPGDVALEVRNEFADVVRDAVPEPEASLGLGYLLGQRRALPVELEESLRIAGLTHVIVASGYNLTILVRLARRLFMKISRFASLAAASGMVVSFIAVTGMSPSMARAGLVTGLSLLAWYYGRKFHPLVLLPLAAGVTVLVQPSYAWNNIGWQLSFAAFAGVMIVAPLLQAYFFGDKKPGVIRQIMGETLSAQIVTLPILISTFGVFSTIALIANLLILPLVPLAMLFVFLTGIGSMLTTTFGAILAAPTTWLLQYMTTTASFLAGLPWAQTSAQVSVYFVVGFYGVLAVLCLYMSHATRLRLRNVNIVE